MIRYRVDKTWLLCFLTVTICNVGCICHSKARHQGTLGPYPEGIKSWTLDDKIGQQQAAKQLVGDIQKAVDCKEKVFRILPGNYRFTKGSEIEKILIRDVDGMHIQAEGVTFWFGLDSTLRLQNCKNVTLSGLTIDYDPLPFTQGTIVALDKEKATLDVRLDEGYEMPEHIGLPKTAMPGDGGYHIRYFDPTGEHLIKIPWEAADSAEPLTEGVYRFYLSNNRLKMAADNDNMVTPGFRVSLNQHGILPVDLYHCGGVTLKEVTIYASPAIAVYERFGPGGNIYRKVRWVRRPGTNRMMVSTRDLFHSYGMKKGPLIENCELSYCGDDMIAIHSFFSLVAEQQSPTCLLMVTPFECDISEGTSLSFLDMITSEPLGSAKVIRLKMLPYRKADLPEELYQKLKKSGFTTRTFVEETTVILVELDREIKMREFSCAQSYDRCGCGAVIRNNLIYEGTVRGIFPRSRDVLIENNRIERLGGAGIILMPETFWLEGVFSENIKIAGNTLVDCGGASFGPGWVEPFLGAICVGSAFGKSHYPPTFYPYQNHHSITIENNRIIGSAAQGIFLSNIRDSIVRNNLIEKPFSKPYGLENLNFANLSGNTIPEEWKNSPDLQQPFYGIYLISADKILLENNTVTRGPSYLRGDIGKGPWTSLITVNP